MHPLNIHLVTPEGGVEERLPLRVEEITLRGVKGDRERRKKHKKTRTSLALTVVRGVTMREIARALKGAITARGWDTSQETVLPNQGYLHLREKRSTPNSGVFNNSRESFVPNSEYNLLMK
jgi:hypothetical protein